MKILGLYNNGLHDIVYGVSEADLMKYFATSKYFRDSLNKNLPPCSCLV